MATNSSVNLKITNNSDGYDVAGGTTARKLTITGADMTLTGSGTNVYTFPASTSTLASLALSEALTNKTYNGLTLTSTTGTFTLTNGKTLSVTNTLTLSGTDSTTMTFPTTSKTLAANDGSNWTFASQAIGDIVYASSTTAFTRLAAVAIGQVLVSAGTGTAPAYSANPQVTTIELGAASDTTLARVSAGVISVEGVTIPTISSTNTLTNKTVTDGINTVNTPTITSIGYLGVPQNSQSTAYTTVMTDAGKHILHPTADNNARTFTIDSNANVAYPIGTTITFINQINTITIAITTDTMTLYPAGTTGSRTLAAFGSATAVKVASTSWVITGIGLT